jgi:hypothetical protein
MNKEGENSVFLTRISLINRQNSLMTNKKLSKIKKTILVYIMNKLILISIMLICINQNNYLPGERILIKKLDTLFFPFNDFVVYIEDFFIEFCDFFAVNFFYFVLVNLSEYKYIDILISFFMFYLKSFLSIFFQNNRPFWNEEFQGYLCKTTNSGEDNFFLIILIFFIIRHPFFKNHYLFYFVLFLFSLKMFLMYINGNIYFTGIIYEFCCIFFFSEFFFYSRNLFEKYRFFLKLSMNKILNLFYLILIGFFIISFSTDDPIDIIKNNKFSYVVFLKRKVVY